MGEFKMTGFKREPRYLVFKLTDIQRYFCMRDGCELVELGNALAAARKKDGRPPFNAVVVESDWPEFEPTWAAIEKRMHAAQPVKVPTKEKVK